MSAKKTLKSSQREAWICPVTFECYTFIGASTVIAFGNNDRRMLKAAKIGVAVCLDEGCSKKDAIVSADIIVKLPVDAIELLLVSKRLKATLRY